MKEETIFFFLILCIGCLLCVIFYQRYTFRKGIQNQLRQITQNLESILERDSDESVMIFTDNLELTGLLAQINRLLDRYRKSKVEFLRSEISSKKMLSNISHDIKTPMTVILGYLEIIRLHGDPDQEMLSKVEDKAQRVMELINQFFTLAKLESGDMDIELSKINLSEVCREAILDFYELLTQKGFDVEIDIPETAVYVQGNKDALQRILFNLISNAIRYGADGKFLRIALSTSETIALVQVTDHGKGIESDFADTVFERLFTMEDSRNREIQGNGLGLTIAKNLAQQLGGDITLQSVPFVETTFSVKLKQFRF